MPVVFRYELPEVFKIARMKHRVMLCSMHDVVSKNGDMQLAREGVRETWAQIVDRRGSLEAPSGYVVRENQEKVSHWITVRYMYDLEVTSTAWIYERRLKSPPRWFKILDVTDHRLAYLFGVRLVERSDEVTPPNDASSFKGQPTKVNL